MRISQFIAGVAAVVLVSTVVSVSPAFAVASTSISDVSVARQSSGTLSGTATIAASGFLASGGACPGASGNSEYETKCYFGFQARMAADGSASDLFVSGWTSGRGDPFQLSSVTFNADVDAVNAVRSFVRGTGGTSTSAWVTVTDTYPTTPYVTLSGLSAQRQSSGDLSFSATVAGGGVRMARGVCPPGTAASACTSGVEVRLASTGQAQLVTSWVWGYSAGDPYSIAFPNGSASVPKVTAFRAYLQGPSQRVVSAWTTFSDPYAATSSVTISNVSSSGRDSNGGLRYKATLHAEAVRMPGGTCADATTAWDGSTNCFYGFEGRLASDGSWRVIDQQGWTYGRGDPFTIDWDTYTGNIQTITEIRGFLKGPTQTVRSGSAPIADPYPLIDSISATILPGMRDSYGQIVTSATVTASGFNMPGRVCENTAPSDCKWGIGEGPGGVNAYEADTNRPDHLGDPFTTTVRAVIAYPTTLRPWISANGRTIYGASIYASSAEPQETAGGGNPSSNQCQCNRADPVDTATGEFHLPATDLTLPGSGPEVAAQRTYTTAAASQDGSFGFGWATPLDARIQVIDPGPGGSTPPTRVRVVQENGSTTYFSYTGTKYTAGATVTATLTRNASTGVWTLSRDHGSVNLAFTAAGALSTITDAYGTAVSYHRTQDGHVDSIGGTGSRQITLTWAGNRISRIADSAGRTATYSYDGYGNLTSATGVDGPVWAYSYDGNHRMQTLTRPGGGVTSNTYDTSGRVISQTDPIGRVTGFAYGPSSTTTTEPDGTREIDEYDRGTVVKITKAAGTPLQQVWSFAYDAALNRTGSTDPLGKTASATYDADGNPLTTTDELGRVTTRTFNGLGEPLTVTDPLGRVSSMTYSAAGDLLSATSPGSHTTSFTYNTDGTLSSTTDAAGKVRSVTYNAAGLPLCTTDPDMRVRCVAYNAAGFVTSSTDAASKVTTTTVDAAGRVLTSKDPLNRTTTFVYDADGNRTKVTDPLNRVTTSAYDVADQLTSTTDPAAKTTTYEYDNRGRRTTVTDPLGHTTTTAYDVLGRATSVTDAVNRVTSSTYDGADRLLTTTAPTGAVTTNVYDAAGQLTSTTDPLGKTTTNTYDAAGRLSSTTDPLGRVASQTYVPDGQVDTVTLPGGRR